MIEKIDLREIKKLAVFLIVVICTTFLTAIISKGIYPHRANSIKVNKQFTVKQHFAVQNESQDGDALKIDNYELYQLRDPFTPLGLSGTQQSQGHMAAGISELLPVVKNVYAENGQEKAKVVYNGKNMTIKEHQNFGHFYVADINSQDNKVILIYGDEKMALKGSPQGKPKGAALESDKSSSLQINGPSSVLGIGLNN